MVEIKFNVSQTVFNRIVDAMCGNFDYQDTIFDEQGNPSPNPVTKPQFAKSAVFALIKRQVAVYEGKLAYEQHVQTANDKANNEIIES